MTAKGERKEPNGKRGKDIIVACDEATVNKNFISFAAVFNRRIYNR